MFKKYTRSKVYLLNFAVALFLIFGITNNLFSRKNGITGQTSGGCGVSGSCHLTSADPATAITFISSTGSFNINTSKTIDVTVRVTHASLTQGGIDIAVKNAASYGTPVGTISNVGSGLTLLTSEITHTSPVSYSSGGYDYTFTWTPPSTPGTYYIQVAANSVNGNNASSGDIWNQTTQAIVVAQGPLLTLTYPNGGENFCPNANVGIQWTASGFNNAKIELSSDGGVSYPTNIATVPASSSNYSWTIPANQPIGTQYKIRISDADDATTKKESNGNFAVAALTQIVLQPQSKSMCTGVANSINLTASGNNLSYQWKKDGSEIAGANTSSYIIPSVAKSDAGTYICTVTGACGTPIVSSSAVVTVMNSPFITVNPKSSSVCQGTLGIVWADASGDNLTYKWQKDGADIAGANSKTLTIPNFQSTNAGNYTFSALSSNCSSSATSYAATIQNATAPSISSQPVNTAVCENSDGTLTLNASGSNLVYQWYQNGTPISNTNSSTFLIAKATKAKSGKYYCLVTGLCDPPISSSTITFDVNTAPVIALNPISKTGTEGGSVTFTVVSSSTTTPIQYQWYKATTLLTDKTSQSLELNNLALTDAGDYTCKLTNSCGNITSSIAKLTVNAGGGGILGIASNLVTFGEVLQGKPEEKQLTDFISNTGKKAIKITEVNIFGVNKDNFKIKGLTLPVTIDASKTQSISVEFNPGNRGINIASADFKTEDNQVVSLALFGKSSIDKPAITFDKPSITMNSELAIANSATMTLTNSSSFTETITSPITFSDADFSLTSPKGTFTIDAKSTKNLVISFTPKSEAKHSCTVTIKADYALNPIAAVITGTVGKSSVDYDDNIISNISAVPNPIENTSEITFDVPTAQQFEFKISDSQGKIVKNYYESNKVIGHYVIKWDGTDNNSMPLNSGTYYGIYQSDNKIKTIILNLKK